MKLETLVEKIKSDIISMGDVGGSMYYHGEIPDREGNRKFTFSYEFPRGKAKDFSKYNEKDDDIDEARANPMEIGKLLLDYYLKDELFQIRFLEKTKDFARIEIYQDIKKIETFEIQAKTDLNFYKICDKYGISAGESGDPFRYDKGREEWLEAH